MLLALDVHRILTTLQVLQDYTAQCTQCANFRGSAVMEMLTQQN